MDSLQLDWFNWLISMQYLYLLKTVGVVIAVFLIFRTVSVLIAIERKVVVAGLGQQLKSQHKLQLSLQFLISNINIVLTKVIYEIWEHCDIHPSIFLLVSDMGSQHQVKQGTPDAPLLLLIWVEVFTGQMRYAIPPVSSGTF